ncbi:unannotated protein [freshwater metagenome]|uniref:Unannotated protein n=1 Tax=freshwater metagenome TaxID=449393 RepID=A0A6J6NW73_9ZZZZ
MKLKFFAIFSLIFAMSFTIISPANAATMIPIKPVVEIPYTGNEQVSDLLLTTNSIALIGTTEAATSNPIPGNLGGASDGFISIYAKSGSLLSSTRLGGAANEIATAAALDADGSIWIVGASTVVSGTTPAPTPTKLLNPDNVPLTPSVPISSALTKLNLWQISSVGQLINSYETQTAAVISPQDLVITKTGLVIFGDIYEGANVRGFYTSFNKTTLFTPIIRYGSKSTQLTEAIPNSDGSFTVVGRSSDLLLKSRAVTKSDAITLKISATGSLQVVARAVLRNTSRGWSSIGAGLLQGGIVRYSNKTEAAVTKFSAINKPSWNTRYLSRSTALVATGTNSWVTFISAGAIPGLRTWKGKPAAPVLLQLGKKGELISAASFTGTPVAIARNNEMGTVVITDSGTSFGLLQVN